jgi:hypothetical protein
MGGTPIPSKIGIQEEGMSYRDAKTQRIFFSKCILVKIFPDISTIFVSV